jgi:hypothetical protein
MRNSVALTLEGVLSLAPNASDISLSAIRICSRSIVPISQLRLLILIRFVGAPRFPNARLFFAMV